MQSEKYVERKLKEAVEAKGGLCIKFLPFLLNGLPDRIVLLPGGIIKFVEVKTEKQTPRKLQIRMQQKISKLGFEVYTIDRVEMIESIL